MIKVERQFEINPGDGQQGRQRELVAELPEYSGTYGTGETGVGEIVLLVCPPDIRRKIQKFVFVGKIMEKNCSSGGTTLRRVVKIPFSGKEVLQDVSLTESLIFSRNGSF